MSLLMRMGRKALAALLGTENYLDLISSTYIRLVNRSFMRAKYPELFYLPSLVKPGDVCIDLGANVGYYATRLSQLTGTTGKVYAVEPVNLFRSVLQRNIRRFAMGNVEVLPYALGAENKSILMATPRIAGVFRHGLTHVVDGEESADAETFAAEMRVPDEIFAGLSRLDFVKCDVEGYETYIFPHFLKTLQRFRPLIQFAITGKEKREEMYNLLASSGFACHGLQNGELCKLSREEMVEYANGDFYFRPLS